MPKRLLAALLALCGVAALAAQHPPFEDSMAQRTLACTACHGQQGRAGPDGFYPRIAGKPAGYLYNQLLNFRDGRRRYGLMAGLLAPLSDAYLQEIAQHFAALDLPYPPPSRPQVPATVLERGRLLVTQGDAAARVPACVRCHGERLTGVQPNTPGLLGVSHDYLSAQLGAWRTGQRHAHAPDCMASIAQRLTPEDLQAAAYWLSSQTLPADPHPVAALPQPAPEACGSAILPAGSPR
ncbi:MULTISPECIES: c-type cytochrome [Ramlibacter]|uniref:C-type cytochrome n=1 Tax=Ramlibacter aquaticus TaxID=2780094 RepID=A0ABR9S9R1_9BURK|nr:MULTISPECIES: c-type cytochrome [Ramlibacter]MBE7939016.1 c-type cytochrome [Ramlibacter aquaticus]